MRKLSLRKSRLIFETDDEVRERGKHRQVIVECFPSHLVVRLKKQRRGFTMTWAGVYQHGALLAANKVKADRAAARKEKAKARRKT